MVGLDISKIVLSRRFVFFAGLAVILFALSASIDFPYAIDDYDYLYQVTKVTNITEFAEYLFIPNNEHVFPVLKIFYFVFYNLFWINTICFHILIIFFYLLFYFQSYSFFQNLKFTETACTIFTIFLCSSTIFLYTVSPICYTHIFFSLFFFLIFLNQIFAYLRNKRFSLFYIFICALLSAFSFGLGLICFPVGLMLIYSAHKQPDRVPKEKLAKLVAVFASSFLISVLPYLILSLNVPVFTGDAKVTGNVLNNFSGASLFEAAGFVWKAIFQKLIFSTTGNYYLSFAFFVSCFVGLLLKWKKIRWKVIGFFFSIMVLNYVFLYIFRRKIGMDLILLWPRYHILALFALCGIYCEIYSAVFQNSANRKKIITSAIYIIILLIATHNAFLNVVYLKKNTKSYLSVYVMNEIRNTVAEYFAETGRKELVLQDKGVKFPLSTGLMSRHLRLYVDVAVTAQARNRIIWGEKTDTAFLEFINSKKKDENLLEILFANI